MTTCLTEDCTRSVYARGLCSTCYQRLRYHGQLDEAGNAIPVKACSCCGAPYQPRNRREDAEYCSRACIDQARTARRRAEKNPNGWRTCDQCATPIEEKRSDARFCSGQCGQTWHNQQRAIEKARLRAEEHPPCPTCGGVVGPKRRVYCSRDCMYLARVPSNHGLTVPEFDALMVSQGNVCAICGVTDWGLTGPQIDHDHESGAVRGILCVNCNNALGRFQDDPTRIRSAIAYLERHAVT